MSFIRPEVRARLWRWREVALTGGLTFWGGWLLWRAADRASIGLGLVALVLTGVFAGLLFVAVQRLRLRLPGRAAGVVQVDEKEISYLSATGGGFVSLDDLTRLEIAAMGADRHWILTHPGGAALVIPVNAEGAEHLVDAFSALPGLRIEEAVRAVNRAGARTVVWARAIT